MSTESSPSIVCENVSYHYGQGHSRVDALRGLNLQIPSHGITAITGPSGSGKSTLLRLLAGFGQPAAGSIVVGDIEISRLSPRARRRYRRRSVGYLLQAPADNFLEYLTVEQHLRLAFRLRGLRIDAEAIRSQLATLGLSGRSRHLPRHLSGGEQQRAAIAFTAMGPPRLILADEPTGQLDHSSAGGVVAALASLARAGTTVVAATHDKFIAEQADLVLEIVDGTVA